MKKIMFSDKFGLTQAVLSGHKTMTRRIIKSRNMIARHWNPAFNADHCYYTDERGKCQLIDDDTDKIIIPRYKVGEVVAIAQSYKDAGYSEKKVFAGWPFSRAGWNNKLFVAACKMPHHIRITDVKVERLQDISDEDCLKEGAFVGTSGLSYHFMNLGICANTPREVFAALIEKVSGKGVWNSNYWVFAYEFELVD